MVSEDKEKKELAIQAASEQDNKKEIKSEFKSEGIKSLQDFFKIEKVSASRFLTALKNNGIRNLQEDDVEICLKGLDYWDLAFSKTLDLTFRASGDQSSLARECITFASKACVQQLRAHYLVKLVLEKSPNDVFADAFHGLKPVLLGTKVDNRAVNLLKAVGIWQSISRELDQIELIELLSTELHTTKPKKNLAISSVFEPLFRPTNKIKAMRDILTVSNRTITEVHCAREAEKKEKWKAEKEARKAEQYRDELTEAREWLKMREEEINDLKAKLKASEDEKALLEERGERQRAVSEHVEGELKGHARNFLERKLTPLLETAQEFAELDPPRKSVVIERLEMAKEEIKGEIEWLKSTD